MEIVQPPGGQGTGHCSWCSPLFEEDRLLDVARIPGYSKEKKLGEQRCLRTE